MLGRSSIEALGLRFWRLTPFDVQHRDAVNLGLRTRVTPWTSVEDDLEFAEHDNYSFQAGQAKVSEDWGHLLELNLRNLWRHNDETWKGLGNVTVFCVQRHCVLARMHAVSRWAHDSVDLPVCHSLIHAVNFEYQNLLSRQTAAVAGLKRAAQWKESHGYMESACKFSPSGILHLHFCQDLLPKKMEFWSSQIWEKRMLCWIQMSVHTHMMQYVEVRELPAGAQETYYIMKQLAIFVTSAMNMVESFFSKARQHPGVPCEPLKFSSQWRLFIFISRESKWGTLKSAGNPRCAVPAESHWSASARPGRGPCKCPPPQIPVSQSPF